MVTFGQQVTALYNIATVMKFGTAAVSSRIGTVGSKNMDMAIEIKINWTANQWRRFLGRADITPLAELTSVMADKIALHIVDQRLEALGLGDVKRDIGLSKNAVASNRHG